MKCSSETRPLHSEPHELSGWAAGFVDMMLRPMSRGKICSQATGWFNWTQRAAFKLSRADVKDKSLQRTHALTLRLAMLHLGKRLKEEMISYDF